MTRMVLQTEHLILRPFTIGDGEAYYAYMSDPAVTRLSAADPISREQAIELIEGGVRREQETSANPTVAFAIELRAGEKMIGHCRLAGEGQKPGEADIAYFLHPSYWGRGYATEAVRALVAYGFATLELRRIFGTCLLENVASSRVMEKAGMREEERITRYAADGNWFQGEFADVVYRQFAAYAPETNQTPHDFEGHRNAEDGISSV